MKKTAQVIADILADQGIEYAFGVAGGEIAEMIEALRRAGITYILVKHETVGAFIAGVCGQISGTPGLCLSTVGPGATNLVTGVANATLDRSPLIALSATVKTGHQATFTHQVLDLDALFGPVTKWNAQITPDNVVDVVSHALRVATGERPGAVHLALPGDVASLPAEIGEGRPWRPPVQVPLPTYTSEMLKPVAGMIAASQYPVLLVGLTAQRAGAGAEITALAERLGAPVISTPKAKGVVSEDHRLAVAVVDMAGWRISEEMLEQADLFIAAGFDPVELVAPWSFSAPLIHVDSVANDDEVYRADLEVVGDVKNVVAALLDLVPAAPRWDETVVEEWKARIAATVSPPGEGLTPWYVIETLRRILPADGLVTVDVGAHKQLAGQVWKAHGPYTYFNSNGLSSMGYAFPAAMAAKLTRPRQDVVCLTGDGGFSMVLSDLETAVRLDLSFVTVVFNDDSLSLIRIAQEKRGFPATGVEGGTVDFARVAEGFGARGLTVKEKEDFAPALEEALASQGPVVVDVRLDSHLFDDLDL
jgi:acetolactate synthase-1/2/3 large subunit